MTLLDKLSQQIENILHKQKVLESENEKLKKQLKILIHVDENLKKLQMEKSQQEKALATRLEKLLNI